jgi:hypothetical protein
LLAVIAAGLVAWWLPVLVAAVRHTGAEGHVALLTLLAPFGAGIPWFFAWALALPARPRVRPAVPAPWR